MSEVWENLDLQDLDGEIWKDILDYEGDYQVSNVGRVKSFKYDKINGRILKQIKYGDYFRIGLLKNGKYKSKQVHRLIYETFKEKLEKGYDVHHINGDGKYNFVDNLESKPHSKHTGDHNKGKIVSEETKKKISESTKGEKNKNFGKHHSEATIKKISKKSKGENNKNSKLTEEQVIQIKLLLKEGKLTQQEIADMFGVKQALISYIKTGKLWSHIRIGEF